MAEGEKSEPELYEAAKLAILAKIPGAAASSTTGDKVLKLAMAYTVLSKGKLPGESPVLK